MEWVAGWSSLVWSGLMDRSVGLGDWDGWAGQTDSNRDLLLLAVYILGWVGLDLGGCTYKQTDGFQCRVKILFFCSGGVG